MGYSSIVAGRTFVFGRSVDPRDITMTAIYLIRFGYQLNFDTLGKLNRPSRRLLEKHYTVFKRRARDMCVEGRDMC
jgi:hypothetical protein